LIISLSFLSCQQESSINYDRENERIKFGVAQINLALENRDQPASGLRISLEENGDLESEAYRISVEASGQILLEGGDDAGLMYGGMELAEQINLYGLEGISETAKASYMRKPGE